MTQIATAADSMLPRPQNASTFQPHTEDVFFHVAEHRLAATRVYAPDGAAPALIHLHGLGPTATRHGVRYLLDDLAAHGHSSVTFEFSGNGESTGVLEEATLRRRRDESLAAARLLDGKTRPVVMGTSMGAHLAAWTVPVLDPRALVLFCPAAYPGHAADLPFDGSLARPGRYADSPAYAAMREFTGDLLIVGARDDQVVPATVLDGYLDSAEKARTRRLIWLDGDHFVHRRLPGQGAPRRDLLALLRTFVADSNRKSQQEGHS
ncbi:alpha/beta fold hydrolase [Streptomyces sp. NPDC006333]|uniref:alpha/beta hydrolase n=1 Tax=Streptomyces sp. NPDC006333 TaxID=3156753 RepID=UPI0033B0F539